MMSSLTVSPIRALSGQLAVAGDKSISHRYVLLGALASGRTRLEHLSPGADVRASLACVEALGAGVERRADGTVVISGWGETGARTPQDALDCMNSGTTMRLLLGVLAGWPVTATLAGDASLSSRPMQRVIDPLTGMGAVIDSHGGRAPLTIRGGALDAIQWTPAAASAQIKSALLLAGLNATGTTVVHEPAATRDHTERAFPLFGLRCDTTGLAVSVDGGQRVVAPQGLLRVPGDPSSAAVWAAAAAALPGSAVALPAVALNPRRLGFVAALERMGAHVTVTHVHDAGGEPVGTIAVSFGDCLDTVIEPGEVPGLIDELPVLAACAAHGRRLEVRGAGELRVKESDRISALVTGLRQLGVSAEEFPDGFLIDGRRGRPRGGRADAVHDHRLVMAFTLVALGATGPSVIDSADSVAVSYPSFLADLRALTA
jgi:3-phosphoshikimate 1-carboxyvinyltransferase